MRPLSMAGMGETHEIAKITGRDEVRVTSRSWAWWSASASPL